MLPKGPYDPLKEEPRILEWWLKSKFFKPEYDPKTNKLLTLEELKKDQTPTYCIIIPPPNAYGKPHMGNVSAFAYEDLFLRYYRQKGYRVYGQPGKDHAGIQGEIVVLREHFAKLGKSKQSMTREEFYKETYKYFQEQIKKIQEAEKRIGLSADYDKDTFTLDPDIVKIVLETFIELWQDGLVYKGVRIVNWCPHCKTALADVDTEKKEREGRFYYIKYPLLKENQRVWYLSFRNKKILNALITGKKTIETRALNPEEPNRYFGDIRPGDIVIAVDKTPDSHNATYPFIVKDVKIFKNIEKLYKSSVKLEKIFPSDTPDTLEELKKRYAKLSPNYLKKIQQNGVVAITLGKYTPPINLHIILATKNKDKKRHIQGYLTNYGIDLILPDKHPTLINENGETFEENARIKAKAYSKLYPNTLIIATDGGLTVPYLKGKWNPLYTRRFIGENKTDKERAQKFLELLKDAKGDQRIVDWNEAVAIAYNGKILFSKTYTRKRAGIVLEKIPSDFKETGYWAAYIIKYPDSDKRWIDEIGKNKNSWANEFAKDFIEFLYAKNYLHFITVATTRPETMLGDTAVVVNPKDKRYKHLIGRKVLLPLVWRKIPIIADGRVDQELGTGALKLTPAHAPEDYEIMLTWNKEHPNKKVDYINVIDKEGKIVGPTGRFFGLSIEKAKIQVVEELTNLGLITKTETKPQIIRVCERCKTPIEPIMSSQWFIKIDTLREPAIKVVKEGQIKIYPKNMTKKYMHWMKNLRDWPISRSLWWGYRFPVWYKGEPQEFVDENGKIVTKIGDTVVKDIHEAVEKGLAVVSLTKPKGEGWVQDENVFDTWFSSGQWPFATLMKWNLFDKFYPTDLMETGYDILEWWVSRMIMLGLYRTGKIPFKEVYLHGLILAEDGQKMSKSKGNVVYPDEIINEFGADALRLFYYTGAKAGAGMALQRSKLEGNKRFLNKLWNISKFVLINIQDVYDEIPNWKKEDLKLTKDDKKILKEITKMTKERDKAMKNYTFGNYIIKLRASVWNVFADWYIETVKPQLYNKEDPKQIDTESRKAAQYTLYTALKTYLILLHPFIPFITDRIWKEMPKEKEEHESLGFVDTQF